MRGSSSSGGHGVSSGNCGDQQGDEEEEGVQSGQPALIEGVVLKKPSVPHDYIKVDYLKRGMTEKAKKEREKNPLHVRKGRSIDNGFQTKFHQDFYESAILSKKYKVARSQYVDWKKFEDMEDPIFNEIIAACKAKHIFRIMGF